MAVSFPSRAETEGEKPMTQAYARTAQPAPTTSVPIVALWLTFWAHVLLLALAATNFSIFSWLWRDYSFQFSAYTYATKSGFGYQYQSDYTFTQTMCYVAAYALGVAYFGWNAMLYTSRLSVLGIVLCLAGAATFSAELTHWIIDYNNSFIASAPGLVLLIAVITGLILKRRLNRAHARGATL
jgi:hypothetical protein